MELKYGEVNPEWKKWDAPYYPHELMDYHTYIDKEDETSEPMMGKWGYTPS